MGGLMPLAVIDCRVEGHSRAVQRELPSVRYPAAFCLLVGASPAVRDRHFGRLEQGVL
jgi:hypothetical protein